MNVHKSSSTSDLSIASWSKVIGSVQRSFSSVGTMKGLSLNSLLICDCVTTGQSASGLKWGSVSFFTRHDGPIVYSLGALRLLRRLFPSVSFLSFWSRDRDETLRYPRCPLVFSLAVFRRIFLHKARPEDSKVTNWFIDSGYLDEHHTWRSRFPCLREGAWVP